MFWISSSYVVCSFLKKLSGYTKEGEMPVSDSLDDACNTYGFLQRIMHI
jgi:hypothetical protein